MAAVLSLEGLIPKKTMILWWFTLLIGTAPLSVDVDEIKESLLMRFQSRVNKLETSVQN